METVELAYDVYESPETSPDKCPILFLHGLFWNKYMLKDLAEALCNATGRKVFCLDLRCHDKSPFHPVCNSEVIAEDLKRFIWDHGLNKVAFVCHSASSTSAYLVAVDQPEMVEKLVLVDHPPFHDYTEKVFRENVMGQFEIQNRFLERLDPSMSLSATKRKIMAMSKAATLEGQKLFLKKAAYELIKVGERFDWKTNHKFFIGAYRQNFCVSPRGRIDHPLLIMRCENSVAVTDEKFSAIVRHNPNAKLLTFEDTTHLLMFEKTDKFLRAVKDFLF